MMDYLSIDAVRERVRAYLGVSEALIAVRARWGYDVRHLRLKRARGLASKRRCVDCGEQAAHWSLNKVPAKFLRVDRGRVFSAGPDDHYSPRCRKCHGKHDADSLGTTRGRGRPQGTNWECVQRRQGVRGVGPIQLGV